MAGLQLSVSGNSLTFTSLTGCADIMALHAQLANVPRYFGCVGRQNLGLANCGFVAILLILLRAFTLHSQKIFRGKLPLC